MQISNGTRSKGWIENKINDMSIEEFGASESDKKNWEFTNQNIHKRKIDLQVVLLWYTHISGTLKQEPAWLTSV